MNRLLSYWILDASSAIIPVIIFCWYWLNRNTLSGRKLLLLLGALLLLVLCLNSPVSILSEYYLFSAHMAVHVILLLLVGPLLVLGSKNNSNAVYRFFGRYPFSGWIAGVGMMWFWHIPAIFNGMMAATMQNATFFVSKVPGLLEDASLIAAGAIFALPVINPDKTYSLQPLGGVVYLFTACIGCSVLGLLITFAPVGMYQHYLSMNDPFRLNNLIANQWHLTRVTDQQIAGLIMWVPCCFLYVADALYLLVTWLNKKESALPAT